MIAIISSTNRLGSNTLKLSKWILQEFNKQGEQAVQIVDLCDLPENVAFGALYENAGKNNQFNALAENFVKADKFVFVIPEYNGSFPGILKLTIDGFPYPNPVKGKKAGLIGLGSGLMGGALAQSNFSDILNYVGCSTLGLKPRIPEVEKRFNGVEVLEEGTESVLKEFVTQMINF
jgi:NAD(P)H-dependent FMN reductase